jgi:hypothetical protein
LSVAHPDALQPHRKTVEIAFGHTAPTHDAVSTDVFESEVDDRQDDADGEDPFRDVEADQLRRLDLGGPLVKNEKIDGSEGIDAVDGA